MPVPSLWRATVVGAIIAQQALAGFMTVNVSPWVPDVYNSDQQLMTSTVQCQNATVTYVDRGTKLISVGLAMTAHGICCSHRYVHVQGIANDRLISRSTVIMRVNPLHPDAKLTIQLWVPEIPSNTTNWTIPINQPAGVTFLITMWGASGIRYAGTTDVLSEYTQGFP
jgi:hypothetical protein